MGAGFLVTRRWHVQWPRHEVESSKSGRLSHGLEMLLQVAHGGQLLVTSVERKNKRKTMQKHGMAAREG